MGADVAAAPAAGSDVETAPGLDGMADGRCGAAGLALPGSAVVRSALVRSAVPAVGPVPRGAAAGRAGAGVVALVAAVQRTSGA